MDISQSGRSRLGYRKVVLLTLSAFETFFEEQFGHLGRLELERREGVLIRC